VRCCIRRLLQLCLLAILGHGRGVAFKAQQRGTRGAQPRAGSPAGHIQHYGNLVYADDMEDGIDSLNASANIGKGGVADHRSAAAYKHNVCRLEQRRSV